VLLCEVLNRLVGAYETWYEHVLTYDSLHSVIRHDKAPFYSLLFLQSSVKWVDIIFVSHSSVLKSTLKTFDNNVLHWAQ
jgi:hypothetical protein